MDGILIVCVGNICRSPMAEALIKQRAAIAQQSIKVSSAGLHALIDYPADPLVQELMCERNLDVSGHRARQVSSELVFEADLILTMDNQQKGQIINLFPGSQGRVHRIGQFSGFDIPDPYKRPRAIFEQTVVLIEQALDEWQSLLWN